jgi:NitT/TauT family transport system substrate-binding protein
VAGAGKANGIDPNSVTWVNIDANREARRPQGQDRRCHDVVLQPASRVRARARQRHGLPCLEGRRREPYGNSIIANGPWLKANRDKAAKFVKVTQKAFAECAKTPEPCVKALVEANGALLYDNELTNWHLVTILMSDETSRNVALGWHDDKRMAATTSWSTNISRWKSRTTSRRPTPTSSSTRT